MYSEEDLSSAVKAGILTEDTAEMFRAFIADQRNSPAEDEEQFRLITGFNDIFVVIACGLLITAIYWIGQSFVSWLGPLLSAGAAWALGEYFIRKRHMALPAIFLLGAFVFGLMGVGIAWFGKAFGSTDTFSTLGASYALTAVATWLHWRRFHVPITVAAGTGAILLSLIIALVHLFPALDHNVAPLLFAAGSIVFFLAMRWDMADPGRKTRKADVAFWLHLLAAPLIVHSAFSAFGLFAVATSSLQALFVILLYIVIALVSLMIDRRALMVSALAYVLYAIKTLLGEFGVIDLGFAITALSIGAGLLLLSAFWHRCRSAITHFLPSKVYARLPHAATPPRPIRAIRTGQ